MNLKEILSIFQKLYVNSILCRIELNTNPVSCNVRIDLPIKVIEEKAHCSYGLCARVHFECYPCIPGIEICRI